MGHQPVITELCLFRNERTDAYLILSVDDFQIAAPTTEATTSARDGPKRHFKLGDLGALTKAGYNKRQRAAVAVEITYIYTKVRRYGGALLLLFWPSGFMCDSSEQFSSLSRSIRKHWWFSIERIRSQLISMAGQLHLAASRSPCWMRNEETRQDERKTELASELDMGYTATRLSGVKIGPSKGHPSSTEHLIRYIKAT